MVQGSETKESNELSEIKTSIEKLTSVVTGLVETITELKERIGGLETKVEGLDQRLGRVETKVEGLDQRLGRVETKVTELSESTEKRFAATEKQIELLWQEVRKNYESEKQERHKMMQSIENR